jgi:hypothetical protein
VWLAIVTVSTVIHVVEYTPAIGTRVRAAIFPLLAVDEVKSYPREAFDCMMIVIHFVIQKLVLSFRVWHGNIGSFTLAVRSGCPIV